MSLPRVLLIGGAPMAGKSSVAKMLARRHDRAVIATDDLGIAIRTALHGEGARIAENHQDYYLSRSVDELWQEELARLRSLAGPIAALARAHAQPWSTPAIIEGWA